MIAPFILRSFMAILFISHLGTSSRLIEVRSMSKYKPIQHNTTRNDEKKYLIVKGKADDYDQTKMPNQTSLSQRRQGLMGLPNIKKSKSGEIWPKLQIYYLDIVIYIEIVNEKWNIFASSPGYRFLESDPVLECCKTKGVRPSCRDSCHIPDSREEWERSGSLQCHKMMDIVASCVDDYYMSQGSIYVFIKRIDNILRKY